MQNDTFPSNRLKRSPTRSGILVTMTLVDIREMMIMETSGISSMTIRIGSVSIQIQKNRSEMVQKMRPSFRGRQAVIRASMMMRMMASWIPITMNSAEGVRERSEGVREFMKVIMEVFRWDGTIASMNVHAFAKAVQRPPRPILQSQSEAIRGHW